MTTKKLLNFFPNCPIPLSLHCFTASLFILHSQTQQRKPTNSSKLLRWFFFFFCVCGLCNSNEGRAPPMETSLVVLRGGVRHGVVVVCSDMDSDLMRNRTDSLHLQIWLSDLQRQKRGRCEPFLSCFLSLQICINI